MAFRILTGKDKHFVLISVNRDSLVKIIMNQEFSCNFKYLGCNPYLYFKMIKSIAASKDDIDMMLDKAKFEADASEYNT